MMRIDVQPFKVRFIVFEIYIIYYDARYTHTSDRTDCQIASASSPNAIPSYGFEHFQKYSISWDNW